MPTVVGQAGASRKEPNFHERTELTQETGKVYDGAAVKNLHDPLYLLLNPRSVAVIGASSNPHEDGSPVPS